MRIPRLLGYSIDVVLLLMVINVLSGGFCDNECGS